METENPNGTATAEPTTPPSASKPYGEIWQSLSRDQQFNLECAAKLFTFGEYNTRTGKFFHRMVVGDDGRERCPTVAEICSQMAQQGRRSGLDPEVEVELVKRLVRFLQFKVAKERWTALATAMPRHFTCRLETYVAATEAQREALDSIKDYCSQMAEHVAAGRGIVLNGTVGSGKTHLLVGAMYQAIRANFTVVYRNVQVLLSDFRSRIGSDEGPTEGDMLNELVKPDILVLDDVISPHGELTAYQEQLLYSVADRRYMAMRPTWVALNVSDTEEAVKRIGAAIIDRWKDGALCLAFDWPSYRKTLSPQI